MCSFRLNRSTWYRSKKDEDRNGTGRRIEEGLPERRLGSGSLPNREGVRRRERRRNEIEEAKEEDRYQGAVEEQMVREVAYLKVAREW